jgi:Ca2+-binding RTX toxin-like protein
LIAARAPAVDGQPLSAGSLRRGFEVMKIPSSWRRQWVNTVSATRPGSITWPATIPKLAPPECASAAAGLTALLVGGGGDDDLRGNQGNAVLVGGPGGDALDGNQGKDTRYGGPDPDPLTQNLETTYDVP